MVDLQLQRQNITNCVNESCGSTECPIDCDLTLPDYLGEVRKILKCCAMPGISSVSVSGNRITAEGSLLIRIVYVTESNCVGTYEQNFPLSGYIDAKDMETAVFADCKAAVGYMNCRAVTSRRISVHGAISLNFCVRKKEEISIVTDNLPCDIEKKSLSLCPANVAADAGRYFAITEVMTLSDRPPIEMILRSSGFAVVNEVKVIKDKALIKGELKISVVYFSSDSNGPERYDTKLPISQIVDATGLDENEIIDTELRVTSLNVLAKADGTGENTLLDISAKMLAAMHAYKETEFVGVTDAYAINGAVDLTFQSVSTLKYYEHINETFTVRRELDIPSGECNKIVDSWAHGIKSEYRVRDDTLEIFGSVTLYMLGIDSNGEYNFFERNVDFVYGSAASGVTDFRLTPVVSVVSLSSVRGTNGESEVTVELNVCADVFEVQNVSLVSDIVASERQCDDGDEDTAIVLYFASENESVWDIARRYNSTVRAVMVENELSGEIIEEDKMLLIPR